MFWRATDRVSRLNSRSSQSDWKRLSYEERTKCKSWSVVGGRRPLPDHGTRVLRHRTARLGPRARVCSLESVCVCGTREREFCGARRRRRVARRRRGVVLLKEPKRAARRRLWSTTGTSCWRASTRRRALGCARDSTSTAIRSLSGSGRARRRRTSSTSSTTAAVWPTPSCRDTHKDPAFSLGETRVGKDKELTSRARERESRLERRRFVRKTLFQKEPARRSKMIGERVGRAFPELEIEYSKVVKIKARWSASHVHLKPPFHVSTRRSSRLVAFKRAFQFNPLDLKSHIECASLALSLSRSLSLQTTPGGGLR